jgi:hypothetical protein
MEEIIIKPCTHKQLVKEMGVSTYVLKTWLQPIQNKIGKRKGYYYNLEQMLYIYSYIGRPFKLQPNQRVTDFPLIEYPFE